MTTINHHPSPDLLLSYSAGSTSKSQAVCIAAHLEFCTKCRSSHQRNNAIGGKLIDSISDSTVNVDLKQRIFSLLDEEPKAMSQAEPILDEKDLAGIPKVLHSLVPSGFQKLRWQIISATARSCNLLKDDNGANIGLLKLKPGGRIAHHGHLGDEYTVVLSGSFSDENGVYKAGDFLLRDASEHHSPVATKDAECMCLTVQEAPLQFTGWFFKFLNPWLRKQYNLA